MAVWLCRAGRNGEYEARFMEDSRVYYTFEEIDKPLSSFSSKKELRDYFTAVCPTMKERAAGVYATQGHIFCQEIKPGDWIVTPSKTAPGYLHFGEVSGDYTFIGEAEESYRHARPVRWFADLRRDQFEQDIQFSLGAAITICKIKQEERIRAIVTHSGNGTNCTRFYTPPPKIWLFYPQTRFPSTSFRISRGTGWRVSSRAY